MPRIHVHFLGIGGSGASAVAAIASAQGFEISGCDKVPFNEFTKVFDQKLLFTGHGKDHLKGVDILAVTPAIFSLDPNNEELLEAKKLNIPVLTWQQFMGKYLEKDKFVIAICGTHGKTTTTSIVGLMLEEAGLDPTVEVGGIVPKWEKNYRVGKGKYFITEADEFNDNFLASKPDITIVTTIEFDHPEYFKDFEAYKNSFKKFLSSTKEKIIANLSDPGVKSLLGQAASGQAWRRAQIIDYSKELIDFPLQVPGKHNILNASAAYQVGLALGEKPEVVKKSLMDFSGTGRRFEKIGTFKGATIYSDFGHHPTEIRVTLEAAREKFKDQKIIVIFQPHMFSRTHALFNDFVKVLKEAQVDQIYIMDIYPSREIDTGIVNSKQLVEAINKDSVTYIPTGNNILEKIRTEVKNNQVLFFLGAGETDDLAKKLLNT